MTTKAFPWILQQVWNTVFYNQLYCKTPRMVSKDEFIKCTLLSIDPPQLTVPPGNYLVISIRRTSDGAVT